jgi:hypothetical protein
VTLRAGPTNATAPAISRSGAEFTAPDCNNRPFLFFAATPVSFPARKQFPGGSSHCSSCQCELRGLDQWWGRFSLSSRHLT